MTPPDANEYRPVSTTRKSWDRPEHKQPKRSPAVSAACPSAVEGICLENPNAVFGGAASFA